MIAGVLVSIFAFTAVYLVDVRDLSTSSAGLGVSTLLVGGVLGRLFWGWLSDLFPSHRPHARGISSWRGLPRRLLMPGTRLPGVPVG
jgi:sugar phosphate permease